MSPLSAPSNAPSEALAPDAPAAAAPDAPAAPPSDPAAPAAPNATSTSADDAAPVPTSIPAAPGDAPPSAAPSKTPRSERLSVRKTYKMFAGGAFVRSESGRSYEVRSRTGEVVAHVPDGSRKDVRDAVRIARAAQSHWAALTAYNRGQILYRVAEVTESRRRELIAEVERAADSDCPDPAAEVAAAIDRWVWYAGWCDKYPQVLGGSNPVAGEYFNFTVPEPMGVIGLAAPESSPLLGLVSRLAPALVSGNAVVALAAQRSPLPAVTLAEILATSDVPAGVVNVLTGRKEVLLRALASHGEVDCLDLTGCAETPAPTSEGPAAPAASDEPAAASEVPAASVASEVPAAVSDEPARPVAPAASGLAAEAERLASESVTRVVAASPVQRRWLSPAAQSPYLIGEFCEYKTVWHPKGQ